MTSHTVVAMFPSRNLLTKALDHISDLQDIEVLRAAIIAKAVSGQTIVIDDDITASEAGIAGGLLGAVIMIVGALQFGVLASAWPVTVAALLLALVLGGGLGLVTGRFAKGMMSSRHAFVKAAQEQVEMLGQVDTGRLALILQVKNESNVLARLRDELMRYKAEITSGYPQADPISVERTA